MIPFWYVFLIFYHIFPLHPPQSKRRIIQIQLLLFPQPPHPPPLPKKEELPPLQQHERSKIIQIIELQLFPSLHPQFVAAKSLICDLQFFNTV